ncbi:MAG: hypothetical protein JO116_01805 [Planctomycetaceae bacterium]|nr:hypothetical protein [Planctomycetaceae bacterium]
MGGLRSAWVHRGPCQNITSRLGGTANKVSQGGNARAERGARARGAVVALVVL